MQIGFQESAIAKAGAGLAARTLSRMEDVTTIARSWRALDAVQKRPTFFQSHDWCLYVWRTRQDLGGTSGIEHRVIVIEDGGSIVGIWPLAIRSSLTGRFATDLGDPFGQYSDVLIAPGTDAGAVLAAAAAEMQRWRIDGLVLRKVRADSPLSAWLAHNGVAVGEAEQAPAIELEKAGGHDAYRNGLNAKTRKNLRNYRNRIGREGRIVHEVIAELPRRAEAVERCFGGRSEWLADSGLSSTAFADPAFGDIVTGLTHGQRGAPSVIAMRLGLIHPEADKPADDLSLHWGFEHQGRYYAFMAWKNPAFDAFSPGRLHLEDVIAAAAARGMATIDLLMPAIPYKVSLSNALIDVRAFVVPFSARGRLLTRCWHGMIRPRLKSIVLAMPPPLRRRLIEAKARVKNFAGRMLGRRATRAAPVRA
jgi:CelD/BcsL family acetyltransferase involved in cellulose biosynthesis